ncbi:MAG: AMP-dependent synthetase/ligase [Solirubrobacterales bacterium]
MSETPTPSATVPALFFARAASQGDALALRRKERGVWRRVSWSQYALEVRRVAAALGATGLRRGDRVAILGQNRPEWLYCHLGTMAAGGVTCGVYPSSSPEQIQYLLEHSGARVLFLEDEEQVEKALPVLGSTAVERAVVWDAKGLFGFTDSHLALFEHFVHQGSEILGADTGQVREAEAGVRPDDTAMIIYTSGTTGPPKGAMLSHRNILFMAAALMAANPASPDDEGVSYLPFAHIYENLVSLMLPLQAGSVVSFVEKPETLFQNLREVSPTVLAGVPRVWEKMASTVELRMQDSTWLKRKAYRWAIGVGRRHARSLREGQKPRSSLAHRIARLSVLAPLRRLLGLDRVRLGLCGAAPASPDLFEYFHALGVPLLEGYGQTESTGVISASRVGRARIGTVGEPLSGVEVHIASDGEVLTRGPHVFQGYFKDPELSAATVDADGWLHTGDVGALEDGHLRILDRKKDILITSGGKNVTPANIENALKWSPYVQDAVVIGDRRKHLVALVLIDEENVVKYAQDHRIPFSTFEDLTGRPEVVRLIKAEVDVVNRKLSSVEEVKRFALLPRRFYEEDGDVTPTRKVKRRAIEKRYADLIESLYKE